VNVRAIMRTGATLALIAAICTALVAGTYRATRERIAANRKAQLEKSLAPALADLAYDSGVTESRLVIPPTDELPGARPVPVYRVYAGDNPVAALFVVTARDGFSGPIRILVGASYDGSVTGIRILEHHETPGLGDKIDQSRSGWVYQFDGRSIGDPPAERWAIHGDGGDFDQLTGASITPRAVIKAVRDTLIYYGAHREEIFTLPATEDQDEDGQ
jgi:H+/Na+-translocating ferredoxin:NAD+ oxidoreductase subunit G